MSATSTMNTVDGVDAAAWAALERGECELASVLGMGEEDLADLVARARWYLEQGDDERALIIAEMVEALDGSSLDGQLLSIDVWLAAGESDRASDHWGRLEACGAGPALVQIVGAQLELARGRLEPARRMLDPWIAKADALDARSRARLAIAIEPWIRKH